jgi:hypothetical protein
MVFDDLRIFGIWLREIRFAIYFVWVWNDIGM